MRLTFTIRRFNPETDRNPHEEDYRLDVGRGMTVLEALIRIKNEQDGALSLRYSCRSAICGSCAMQINGSEKLACRTSIRKELERHGRITIAPLPNLPVIKDLVVDMSHFWEKIRAVTPWLGETSHPTKRYGPSGQLRLKPESYHFHNVDACIMCGACVGACTSHAVSPGFLGPAALAKSERFLADPREPGPRNIGGSSRCRARTAFGIARAATCACRSARRTCSPWRRSSACAGPPFSTT
ncbi:MAG: succinate dehydrogenase/fumarate reductase iron-sulfur subunit [Nitrospiraceae bacterium]